MATVKANTTLVITPKNGATYDLTFGGITQYGRTSGDTIGVFPVDKEYTLVKYGEVEVYALDQFGVKSYEAGELPDPESLPVGSEIVIDNISVKSSSGGLLVREAGAIYPLQSLGIMRSRAGADVRKDMLSNSAASTTTAYTFEQLSLAKRKPIAFRVVYKHNISSGTHTPIQVCVGSKTLGNNATTSNIVSVTWNGAATPSLPLTSGVAFSNFVVSDLMPISVVDRADGYAGHIIAARVLLPIDAGAGSYCYSQLNGQATQAGQVLSLTGNRIIGCAQQTGDFVTTNQSGFTAIATITHRFVDFIYYYDDGSSDVFMGCGDSITTGQFTTLSAGGEGGWIRQVVTGLNADGIKVDCASVSTGGVTSAGYLSMAKQMIPVVKPKAASYSMITPNDADTIPIATSKARVIDFIELCLANGVIPVITTPCPRNDTPANEASIRSKMVQARDWLLNTVNGVWGIPVVDIALTIGSQADITKFADGYGELSVGSSMHPNDAGHAAIANAALPVIKPIFYV